MKKLIFLSLVTFLPTMVWAQNWDIEKCISYALDNNIQVKQATNTVDVNKLSKQQAKFNYLPSLSASVGYGASFGRSLDPTTYQFLENTSVNNVNGSLSLGTQLFAGMSKLHNLRKSDLNLMASIEDVAKIKNEITVAIAAAYLQILYNKEQVANSKNQLVTLGEQIVRTKKLVDAGSVALGAQLELEAQSAAEQYNLVSYENTLINSMLNLTQLLELRDVPAFDIAIPDVSAIVQTPISASVDQVNQAAQILPQIKGAELRLRAAEVDVKLAQARYYPTLSLSANYGSSFSDTRMRPQLDATGTTTYGKYPFFDQFGDNASAGVSLSLQVPIFSGLTTRRNVRIARLNTINSDYALQLTKDKLYKEIQQAYTDATGALNRYRSAESSVKSSVESFHYAEQKFAAGATNSVDYTTAKNNLLNAQSMMIQAKYEYVFRVKLLDFYKGVPITL